MFEDVPHLILHKMPYIKEIKIVVNRCLVSAFLFECEREQVNNDIPEVCQNFNAPMYLNAFPCLYFHLLYANGCSSHGKGHILGKNVN